jgi:ABC-2 type transport system permease protein
VRNQVVIDALVDPRWLLAVLVIGPLMALLSVTVSLIVSSRVNDPRVAEQISMVVIIPVLGLFFGQIAGLFVINQQIILLVMAGLLVVDAFMVYLSVRLFQRETILTRWK